MVHSTDVLLYACGSIEHPGLSASRQSGADTAAAVSPTSPVRRPKRSACRTLVAVRGSQQIVSRPLQTEAGHLFSYRWNFSPSSANIVSIAALNNTNSDAAAVIEDFLRRHPRRKLWVAVGYASIYGLGWLNRRTQGRQVCLLIGDTRTGFTRSSERNRAAAAAFLAREDVEVLNWYSTKKNAAGEAQAHLKCFMVWNDRSSGELGAALVGSANLTGAGLHRNVEMMAEASEADLPRLFRQMRQLFQTAWPAGSLGILGTAPKRPRRSRPPEVSPTAPAAPVDDMPSVGAQGGGCMPAAAVMVVGLIAAIVSVVVALGGFSDAAEPAGPVDPIPAAETSKPPSDASDTAEPQAASEVVDPPAPTTLPVPAAPRAFPVNPAPDGFSPTVAADASTYGDPKVESVQYAAWIPVPYPDEVLSYVRSWSLGSRRDLFIKGVKQPWMEAACSYGERVGPHLRFSWALDSGDVVTAMWVDGEQTAPGRWTRGSNSFANALVPADVLEFVEITHSASMLRLVLSDGRDMTFDIAGFYDTPIQNNIEYCGQY